MVRNIWCPPTTSLTHLVNSGTISLLKTQLATVAQETIWVRRNLSMSMTIICWWVDHTSCISRNTSICASSWFPTRLSNPCHIHKRKSIFKTLQQQQLEIGCVMFSKHLWGQSKILLLSGLIQIKDKDYIIHTLRNLEIPAKAWEKLLDPRWSSVWTKTWIWRGL